jgi:hypothetical protein
MGRILTSGYIERYNELVKRLLSVKGEPLEGGSPELLFDLTLEQAPALAYEWYWLMGISRYASGYQTTAVPGAGNFSACEMLNPAGSGILATVEAIILGNQGVTASYILKTANNRLGGGVGFASPLDLRDIIRNATKVSACQFRISAGLVAAIGGTEIDRQNTLVNEETLIFPVSPGIVLSPNQSIAVGAIAAQIATSVNFLFRERQLGASELTPS